MLYKIITIMNNTLSLDKLIVETCTEKDGAELLNILKETQMDVWLSDKPDFQSFYIIKEPDTRKIICCFTFSQEGHIGILKNLVVKKDIQKKGIGTHIANNLVPKVAKKRDIKKLYLHGNNRGPYTSNYFWDKSIFTHIKSDEVKDKFMKDYYNHLVNDYSEEILCKESIYFLDLENCST